MESIVPFREAERVYKVGFVSALLVYSKIRFNHCPPKCVLYSALEGPYVESGALLSGCSVVFEGWKSISVEEGNNSPYIFRDTLCLPS